MAVLSMADQEILPHLEAKGEARRAYGEGKETSLRPIRRASISATMLHAAMGRAQPARISRQFDTQARPKPRKQI